MTIAESKNIRLEAILERHGHRPTSVRRSETDVWYLSPLREEREPSFHVNRQRNVWYDFGLGECGDALDLVCRLTHCSKKEGLVLLATYFGHLKTTVADVLPAAFTLQENDSPAAAATFKILKQVPIQHPALIKYLSNERFLKLPTCQKFLQELHFENTATRKQYFAVGMPNRAGGWEIRNPYFKSALGGKDISFLRGQGGAGERSLSIFEGMMDFLSACEFYGSVLLTGDVVVLHSSAISENLLAELALENYARIYTYFDNDSAGEAATLQSLMQFSERVEPCNGLFFPFLDFNEWWVRKWR